MRAVQRVPAAQTPPRSDDDELLDEKRVESEYGVSARTLQSRRTRRLPPKWIKFGRSVRYRRGDLRAFIIANTIDPEAAR